MAKGDGSRPVDVYCAGGTPTSFPVGSVLLTGELAIGHDSAGHVVIVARKGGLVWSEPLDVGVKLLTIRGR